MRRAMTATLLACLIAPNFTVAQMAPVLGDAPATVARHVRLAKQAARAGARLVLFPELSLTGYLLQDLVAEVALRIDRDGPLRPLFALGNLVFRLRRSSFRIFLHPTTEVEALIAAAGLRPAFHRLHGMWQVSVFRT